MTALATAVDGLCAAVRAAARGEEADVRAAAEQAAFVEVQVRSVPGEAILDHVVVRLADAVPLAELERLLGPGRFLPRRPSGGRRTALFDRTLPGEGESGATVLAEVDAEGLVHGLTVRADRF